jgi:hypothetical protein
MIERHNMNGLTIKRTFHIRRQEKGQKQIRHGTAPHRPDSRVPRISRLMALAIKFDCMLKTGELADMAQIAARGQVTRARMTQIMNLNLLAPDIQERLLCLPQTDKGRDEITIRTLQKIALEPDWRRQRDKLDEFM